MTAFFGGVAGGYIIAQLEIIWRAWRAAKATVNEVRRQHGQPEERRWWRM